jgi:Kef-type K+ transport system membrane component KefB
MEKFFQYLQQVFQTPFQNPVLVIVLILFVILLAPIIFRSLKIPGIIGLIIAGLIIGPHELNLIEKNAAVDLFSTLGLLYIMFLAGLELDIKEFNRNKHKSYVFGFFTFIIPLAFGYYACRYLLNFSFETSLLVASMLSTNTPLTYPIVSRLGLSRIPVVGMSVGGTMLTDTAALLILAVISGTSGGGESSHFWIQLSLSFLLFIGIVFILIPRLTLWFFRNLESEKHSHFVFVLSMVFFSAFLSKIAGLEPIIGAFAAGIALNKLIPRTSTLMNRIEFVGNSLFIPFFLISVGMLVNLKGIFNSVPGLIIAGIFTVLALLGKYIAAWITAKVFRFSANYRNLIFGLSSPRAASAIAIILVGFEIGIVDENILNGTIVVILSSCLIASFVTEHSAKKVLITEEIELSRESSFQEQKILVPVYNPNNMERLIDVAVSIKMPKNRFPIVGLSVVEDDQQAQQRLLEAKKMLDKAILYAAAADQEVEIIATISQNVSNGIKRVAKEIFATEIIMGFALKNQFTDLLFGNVVKDVVENTWQSVWVCSISPNLYHYKKINVVCPRYADREYGFNHWLNRISLLSGTLKASVSFISARETYDHISEHLKQSRDGSKINHYEFNNWTEYMKISSYIHPADLNLIILPRKGGVAYDNSQEGIPRLMSKNFENHNFILVYPAIADTNSDLVLDENFDSTAIDKGLKDISQKAGSLTNFLRKKIFKS